jgi:DDE family transposase
MLLGSIFDRFVSASPISVMIRGLMERALIPDQLDALFRSHAQQQYQRELLFSTTADLMCLVVCGVRPAVHAAFQALRDRVPVSLTSVYNKLDGIEPTVSAALVRHTAACLTPVIGQLGGQLPELVPGYRVKIVDGNHLAATQRRLAALRDTAAAPLPGLALVVLDPVLMQAIDVFPCEDGHAQERSLLGQVLQTARPKDVWIDDRNFCTTDFLFGLAKRQACFLTRQHQGLPWEGVSSFKRQGTVATGEVFEQTVRLEHPDGTILFARRVKVVLAKPTRDGDRELFILTNLPVEAADAVRVAELYRGRWTIEILFAEMEKLLSSEIDTLAYPKAALFGFCTALAAYNIYSAAQAALRAEYGATKIEAELSEYYVADEIAMTYRGMMIAIPEEEWQVFGTLTVAELADLLRDLARRVRLDEFKKHPRGPKKPKLKPKRSKRKPHVSTAKLLAERKKKHQ